MRQLVVLDLATDLSIAVACAAIAFALIHFARRPTVRPYGRVFVAFAVFVIADGATHLAAVWTLWQPSAWLATVLKLTTALAAVAVALLLPPLVPKALALGAASALLDAAPDAIILIDASGTIRLVNERAERLFGYPRRELLGRPSTLVLPDDVRVARDAQRDVYGLRRDGSRFLAEVSLSPLVTDGAPVAGGTSSLESVIERGEPTLVRDVSDEWLATRVRDAEHFGAGSGAQPDSLMLVPLRARGRTLGVVSFALANGERRYTLADLALAEDLAQRAALAADNARLYREAQDASRAKDEFLAVLSHELRTPLTPVLGWVRMLRTGTLAPEATERALDTVERNTRLQAQLVEDLLDVSRIIAGKLSLDLRPVALGPIVDAVVEGAAAAAVAKSIVVTRRVEPNLPRIEADANRLQQVVANLLSNAVKFTPAGGRVEVAVARAGDAIRLSVADTGDGLQPEVAPHIFDRFRQADSTITRQHGGLGLGLSIVRHIVERHGGTVQATRDRKSTR